MDILELTLSVAGCCGLVYICSCIYDEITCQQIEKDDIEKENNQVVRKKKINENYMEELFENENEKEHDEIQISTNINQTEVDNVVDKIYQEVMKDEENISDFEYL